MDFADATEAHVPDLVHLINTAYRTPGARPGWTDERLLLAGPRIRAETLIADFDRGRFLVLRPASGEPIMACARITPEPDGAWYLSSIAVAPWRQGAGLGAALLREIERQAAETGAPCLRMTVIQARDTLIAWYERRGFRHTGATLAFPYDDPGVGRPLRADLSLVVLEKPIG